MNGARRHRIVRPLIGCLMLIALLSAAIPASAATPPLYARPTGHTIPAAFRPLWEQTGGADGLGWPLDEVKPTTRRAGAVVRVRPHRAAGKQPAGARRRRARGGTVRLGFESPLL